MIKILTLLLQLKKKLEEWHDKNTKDNEISINKIILQNNDKISISYKKKIKTYLDDQSFNTGIKLGRIKDIELLKLLNKYKEHNFI